MQEMPESASGQRSARFVSNRPGPGSPESVALDPPADPARIVGSQTPYGNSECRASWTRACPAGSPTRQAIPLPGLLVKRVLDVLLASTGLILLWPALFLIAVAVKLESAGSAIYPSLRAGKDGVRFVCYKFRTMVAGANDARENLRPLNQREGPFFKIADDPRVTKLGRFLRRYSLDELPQLWNVLKGEMSLVGPRPHPVEDIQHYRLEHYRRLLVKPGMTGLWQVTARDNPSFETCMLLDLGYIRQWSVLLDWKILMRTIPAVLAGDGR